MKRTLVSAAITLVSTGVWAEEDSSALASRDWHVNFGLSSEYVFRGTTRSNGDPAVQGGIDYYNKDYGLYGGVWASTTEFNRGNGDEASLESDFFGGFRGQFSSQLSWDIGARYYYFPAQNADRGHGDLETAEVGGRLTFAFQEPLFKPRIDGGVAYSPDYFGEDGDSVYADAGASVSLPHRISAFTRVGYLNVEGDRSNPAGYDYVNYVIGVRKTFGLFDFDLAWHDTDHGCDRVAGQADCQALVFGVTSRW